MKNDNKMDLVLNRIKDIKKIKSLFPKLIVTRIIDYSSDLYVVEAVESLDKKDYSDPYYAVEKKNYKILTFSPAYDFPEFFDALENRTLWCYTEGSDK